MNEAHLIVIHMEGWNFKWLQCIPNIVAKYSKFFQRWLIGVEKWINDIKSHVVVKWLVAKYNILSNVRKSH
jgi:hypothetical protein